MRRTLFNTALENDSTGEKVIEVVDTVDAVDHAEAEARADSNEVDIASDQIEEAEGVEASLGRIEEVLPKEGPAAEGTAELIAPVLEHFSERLGFEGSIVAMEAYANGTARQQIADFREKLGEHLVVAQEGFGTRVGSWFERAFRSEATIEKRLQTAAAELAAGEARTDVFAPDWVGFEVFKVCDGSPVTGDSVIAAMKKINTEADALEKFVSDFMREINNISKMLNRGGFFADENSKEAIEKALESIKQITEKHTAFTTDWTKKFAVDKSGELKFKAIPPQQAKKIADEVFKLNRIRPMGEHVHRITAEMQSYTEAYKRAALKRLAYLSAKDLKTLWGAGATLSSGVITSIFQVAEIEEKLLYGTYRYLKASKAVGASE